MQEYTPEQYNDIFDKLPQPLMDVLAVTSTNDKVFAIAKKHRLQFDQMGILNNIVMHILLGIIAAKDFLGTVKKEISIDPHEAALMVGEIDDEIFKPLRDVMEKTFRGGAPYKPRTISTIDENDEEHLHLTKHDVLREIENPEPAEIKKVNSLELSINSEKTGGENPKISETTEVEEYNQELTGNKIEVRKVGDSQLSVDSNKQKEESSRFDLKDFKEVEPLKNPVSMPSAPKTIAEIKLSGVTSVEKGNTIVEEKKESTPQVQTKIDPYREPIQ